jgi:CO dehydrogenase/acetyl-CoA synthase beta subunit
MTDISSLPVSSDTNAEENDTFVNNLLNDLNGTDHPELCGIPEEEEFDEEEYDEDDEEYYEEETNTTLSGGNMYNLQELLYNFKTPLVVIIVAFVFNTEFVEKLISSISFFGENSKLNIFGVIFKSILIGVVFYVIYNYLIVA